MNSLTNKSMQLPPGMLQTKSSTSLAHGYFSISYNNSPFKQMSNKKKNKKQIVTTFINALSSSVVRER